MTSILYNIDRMANPEASAKSGAIEGIRRMGEVHVFAARFPANRTVALGPGIAGKAHAKRLKTLNGRLRHRYDANKIPTGFSNRYCIGGSCHSWGGSG